MSKIPESLMENCRSVLVPYSEIHDDRTVFWLNSPDIRASFGIRQVVNVKAHRAWVDAASQDTRIWAVMGAGGRHVGNVLLKVTERHRSGYFQIYLGDPESRGLGIGKRALIGTLQIAFEDLHLHRVWLHTFEENQVAESLYRKCGFQLEGVEREALFDGSRYVSQRRWSLLSTEWPGLCAGGSD